MKIVFRLPSSLVLFIWFAYQHYWYSSYKAMHLFIYCLLGKIIVLKLSFQLGLYSKAVCSFLFSSLSQCRVRASDPLLTPLHIFILYTNKKKKRVTTAFPHSVWESPLWNIHTAHRWPGITDLQFWCNTSVISLCLLCCLMKGDSQEISSSCVGAQASSLSLRICDFNLVHFIVCWFHKLQRMCLLLIIGYVA